MSAISGGGNTPLKNYDSQQPTAPETAAARGSSGPQGGQAAHHVSDPSEQSEGTLQGGAGTGDAGPQGADGGGSDQAESATSSTFFDKNSSIQKQGQGLPLSREPGEATGAASSDAYKTASPALQNVVQAGGDASKISGDSWKQLAQSFAKFSPAEQSSVKDFLNRALPGSNTKTGVGGGDALQFTSNGLSSGDADAAKNRLADLQKKS